MFSSICNYDFIASKPENLQCDLSLQNLSRKKSRKLTKQKSNATFTRKDNNNNKSAACDKKG